MTFHPATNPANTILFVARDRRLEGNEAIIAIYELDLTINARESFKWWFGATRDANPGATIDIIRSN